MTPKITIIGAGFVGSTTAHWIASKALADVVLLDIAEGVCQGKALDLQQAMPIEGVNVKVTGTSDYADIQGSDVVVITAGLPRTPGMSRDDLLAKNAGIMEQVCHKVKAYAPDCILIVVSNPLDAMVWKAWKVTGFKKQKVVGMAGILDSTRFRTFVAQETGFSVKDVQAMVLGGHGDSMVPLKRFASIGGIPLSHFLTIEKIDQMVERTKHGGAEIVGFLKTGSAYFAPARAICEMVEAILLDQKRVLPCAALCEGEYGAQGIFVGVPVVLGRQGVESILEINLDTEETKLMESTIEHVSAIIQKL